MLLSIFTYIAIWLLFTKRKQFFFCRLNTERNTYKGVRALLIAIYVACWAICLENRASFDLFVINDGRKGMAATPLFMVISTVFVATILMLDINYRAARKQEYERNFIKHMLLGWSFVLPIMICMLVNKPLIILFAMVTITGTFWDFRPASQKPLISVK